MKTKVTIPLTARALRYASRGFAVLPMHAVLDGKCTCHQGQDCKNAGKHPRTEHGVKDATTDRKTISRWWKKNPDANIGIATGEISGIVVIDIDPRHGGDKTFEALGEELGQLPETVTSETGGGGLHLVFAYPDVRVRKDSAGKLLGLGVDILSDGAIMIAPGSSHKSGRRYRWQKDRSTSKLKPASLPQKWLDRLTGSNDDPRPDTKIQIILEGQRNNTLARLAGTMHRSGLSPEAILAALLKENETSCRPPLEASEVAKIANSIASYAVADSESRQDDAEQLLHLVLSDHFHAGKHLIFGPDSQFWHYSGKLWSKVAHKWIEGRILASMRTHGLRTSQRSAHLIKQVKTLLEAQLSTDGDPFGFVTKPPRVINCANGEACILDDGTIELRPHRPESHLIHLLDVDYDPQAKCPEYDSALLKTFSKATKPRALRRHWNELVGYLIQPDRSIPLIVVLLGPGANGKTVLARTIVRLIGPAQVHAARVEELDKNRFALGSLLGKRLFLDDDVRAGARLPDGTLKMISEAKEVTGENKYKSPFNFIVLTVPMLLCNNVPSLADLSNGMQRRLMVIPFDRTFSDAERDDGLFERIWSNELSGILNQALTGYARLLKRGRFKPPTAVRKATSSWLEQANPVPAFISECCLLRIDAKCPMTDLYLAYKKWATDSGFTMIQNKISFGRNLEHLGYKKVRATGGVRAIAGVALILSSTPT